MGCHVRRTMTRMNHELKPAFIGGGNMATALASGIIGKRCDAHDIHVIDTDATTRRAWADKGVSVAGEPDAGLAARRIWIFCVKPQHLKAVALACRPFLHPETLVISVAAGISSATLAAWLGTPGQPWTRLVRCMPNTPALVGAGATGLMALEGVSENDKAVADELMRSVGQVVWVESDADIDAVTALSGSGPAYVFLFLDALISGGVQLGLSHEQAQRLAHATLEGANQLAASSHEDLATLRERVTSKGGTTAAALAELEHHGFAQSVRKAMAAAHARAAELSHEFSK